MARAVQRGSAEVPVSTRVPRWGWVTAQPHEFLVQVRGGQVVTGAQGGTCWKWPSDSVALVDTSIRRLMFTADQVTREKTGVAVTGLAVFRIVEPMLAWKMLDLSSPEGVEEILREMLLGATRRLVANLSLEECMTRRKDALAAELLAEIAPVVGGRGADGDTTSTGWGLGLDTIEVQDVRVLSDEVFSKLQAPYREGLELEARRAREAVAREEALLQHEAHRLQEARRQEKMAMEAARLAAERQRALDQEAHQVEVSRQQHAARIARDREQHEHEAALAREKAVAAVEVARLTAEAERTLGEARAELERTARAACDHVSEDRLRELLLTRTLPEVAQAWRGSFDKIVVTGASDLSVLGQGLSQVLATADAFGLRLPGALPPRP
jgi:flotillin